MASTQRIPWRPAGVALVCLVMASAALTAQGAQPDRPAGGLPPLGMQGGRQGGRQGQPPMVQPGQQGQADMSALSVQQMFDAMTVLEAERFLPLTAEQYPTFVQRVRRLQEARAQTNRQRFGFLNELRRMTQPNGAVGGDDAAIEAKVRELDRFDVEGRGAIRRALEELDAMLTPRQRARFRILEDNLEKKKLEFLAKARQGGGFIE